MTSNLPGFGIQTVQFPTCVNRLHAPNFHVRIFDTAKAVAEVLWGSEQQGSHIPGAVQWADPAVDGDSFTSRVSRVDPGPEEHVSSAGLRGLGGRRR